MTPSGADQRTRRGYTSTRRRQQAAETRELVLTAAASLFAEHGWARTGMRDVAKAAGVSVETVYANFRSKPELLLAAIDVGVVGDDEPVPLSDRPEFAALGLGSSDDRIAAVARMLAGINRRTAGLRRALDEASVGEPQLAAKLHELELRRRDNIRDAAEMVLGRPVDDLELDGLWAFMGVSAYDLLTEIGGRPESEYETWIAWTIRRLFPQETT